MWNIWIFQGSKLGYYPESHIVIILRLLIDVLIARVTTFVAFATVLVAVSSPLFQLFRRTSIHICVPLLQVPHYDHDQGTRTELRLMRAMLERLECAFAKQEAKLDQLLAMEQHSNTHQPNPTSFSTPDARLGHASLELPLTTPAGQASIVETSTDWDNSDGM